jgi:hypothetical protein
MKLTALPLLDRRVDEL